MDQLIIIPIVIAIALIFYISITIHRPKDESRRLFHKLMDKGCLHCGGDFALGVEPADDGKIGMVCVKCDKCYDIHLDDEKAWEIN